MTKEPPISSLLPCPFCGKEPSMWSRDMILPWVIQCCASMVSSDKKMLIESWNTRAHSTPDPERGDGPSIPSEAERAKRWRSLTDHLPALPPNTETSWLWSDKDIEMLRAACFRRFGESLRTESLFCIAATGIRIYLSQLQTTPDREGLVERVADEVIAKHGQLLTDLFQEVPSEFIADDRAGVARGFLRAMTKTAIAIVRQHQAGQQNGSASSCDEETLGASTAEIAGESPAAPSTTENKVVMPHTLLSAFHKYGRHTRECEAEFAKQFPRPKCICGYDDVLADLIEFQHDASGYSGESPVKSGTIPTNYDSVEGTAPTDRSGHVGNAVANHARGEISVPEIETVETLLIYTFLEGYRLGRIRIKPLARDKLTTRAVWIKDMMLQAGAYITKIDEAIRRPKDRIAAPPMLILSLEKILDEIDGDSKAPEPVLELRQRIRQAIFSYGSDTLSEEDTDAKSDGVMIVLNDFGFLHAPAPVAVSLEKCIKVAESCGYMDCTGAYIINKKEAVKAVLDAAGVKYHED